MNQEKLVIIKTDEINSSNYKRLISVLTNGNVKSIINRAIEIIKFRRAQLFEHSPLGVYRVQNSTDNRVGDEPQLRIIPLPAGAPECLVFKNEIEFIDE